MYSATILSVLAMTFIQQTMAQKVHGQGAEGTEMGPVAFLWPNDRPWSAASDNISPCGSAAGVTNRTTFPLSQGEVALSIADEAYQVAFKIAYDNEPRAQSDFGQQVVSNVTQIEPGHQCYKIAPIPESVKAGSNATIQLEYWASDPKEQGGAKQSFFACADVTFVEAKDFTLSVPCFNVTASDFSLPGPSGTAQPKTPAGESGAATVPSSSSSTGGLTSGEKAGIAVGTIVGSFGIVGILAFMLLRKKRAQPADVESPRNTAARKGVNDAMSERSA
ncbi:diphenol oxidase [Apiospora arundinis]